MSWRQVLQSLVDTYGDVSKLAFLAIAVFILLSYRFKSYVLLHSSLRKIVEYFGNVSPKPDVPKTKSSDSTQARGQAIV